MNHFNVYCSTGDIPNIINSLHIAEDAGHIVDINDGFRHAIYSGKVDVIKWLVKLYKTNIK